MNFIKKIFYSVGILFGIYFIVFGLYGDWKELYPSILNLSEDAIIEKLQEKKNWFLFNALKKDISFSILLPNEPEYIVIKDGDYNSIKTWVSTAEETIYTVKVIDYTDLEKINNQDVYKLLNVMMKGSSEEFGLEIESFKNGYFNDYQVLDYTMYNENFLVRFLFNDNKVYVLSFVNLDNKDKDSDKISNKSDYLRFINSFEILK